MRGDRGKQNWRSLQAILTPECHSWKGRGILHHLCHTEDPQSAPARRWPHNTLLLQIPAQTGSLTAASEREKTFNIMCTEVWAAWKSHNEWERVLFTCLLLYAETTTAAKFVVTKINWLFLNVVVVLDVKELNQSFILKLSIMKNLVSFLSKASMTPILDWSFLYRALAFPTFLLSWPLHQQKKASNYWTRYESNRTYINCFC